MRPNTSLTTRQLLTAMCAVAVGGAVGTLLRDLITKLDHRSVLYTGWTGYAPLQLDHNWIYYIPWALLCINFLGVLGATRMLRGPLKGHDPNDPARLLIITGFFGGLTSYSGLFVDFDLLWHHSITGCFFVAAAAIASGFFGAWLGLQRRQR